MSRSFEGSSGSRRLSDAAVAPMASALWETTIWRTTSMLGAVASSEVTRASRVSRSRRRPASWELSSRPPTSSSSTASPEISPSSRSGEQVSSTRWVEPSAWRISMSPRHGSPARTRATTRSIGSCSLSPKRAGTSRRPASATSERP